MEPITIILAVVSAVVFGVLGFVFGNLYRKKVAEAKIGSANEEALRIVNQAVQTAESKKKEAILEAKDEIHKLRSEVDKELRERRAEVQRQENRINHKEENLDKKTENLEKKEELLAEKLKAADAKMEEVEMLKRSQLEMLEKVSGYSKEQAKALLMQELDEQLTHEKALKIWILNSALVTKATTLHVKLFQVQFSVVQQTTLQKQQFQLLHFQMTK